MMRLVKQGIQIIIVDDGKAEKCDAGCGIDWSSPEVRALAERQIGGRFGDIGQLEYLDLSEPFAGKITLGLRQKFGDEYQSLPVLVINGEVRIAGQFDIRMLLDAIDAEMEIKP